MFATGECVSSTSSLIQLWLHETSRIYADKLIEQKDQETFMKTIVDQIKKTFSVSNYLSIFYLIHNIFFFMKFYNNNCI